MAINDISLTAGMRSNLLSLQGTASLLDRTQERLSTGKKLNDPIDNAVNYFLAKSFTDRASDLSISKDNMATAIQTITAASNGVKAISALVDSAKSIASAAAASSSSTDRTAYHDQFATLLTQIDNIANGTSGDATFNGTNLLDVGPKTLIVDLGDKSTLTVTGFNATTASTGLSLTTGGAWSADATGDGLITTATNALASASTTLRAGTTTLSSNLNTVTIRQTFASDMISTLQKGADNLTLADMNEEGANMLALQTRQSLGITSLSLASQANQSILKLF